ncbi:glycosyltransferase family 2 protein [Romeria aff. gracilis LEGE 07310]|uniref:Glycosyltransferase family 2 protein n=1 Tax=Vasconcelosia minhoensis LEGE 07310 TaxID=915328 RepID=A0A8J7AKR2_9CYAN|nr:glycosyltransferase family 2 protein [Romeria gracilis]MBE9076935.1 glycosyltransferase family 2 protein [Romeria aff. gracilis LEGE 07310]
MLYPIKVIDIELSRPITSIENLEGYLGLQALVRLHGVPLGYVKAPVTLGHCTAESLSKLILEQHSWSIICQLLKNGLVSLQRPEELTLEALIDLPPAEYAGEWPLVTVAVCTRDRPEDMKLCLEAITQLDYPHLDILVVDNAPQTEATKELLEHHYPQVRYVREPRPGLDWARNRAILEAKGEIIAYTDDDVVVDPGWVKGLAQVFAENPEVMAVTGLVVPYELETYSQVLFESYGGFGRGFKTRWYRYNPEDRLKAASLYGASGKFGTGANMAYRVSLFERVGGFDPAMDVGTVTNGGGDLEMFFRVIKEHYPLVYEPRALVRHRHRRERQKLQSQIANNGIGLYAYFTCCSRNYPDERWAFIKLSIFWIRWWLLARLWKSFKYPQSFPRQFIWNELKGCFIGLTRYQRAKRDAIAVAQDYRREPEVKFPKPTRTKVLREKRVNQVAVQTVDIAQPLKSILDTTGYQFIQLFVFWQDEPLGTVRIQNDFQPFSVDRLADRIAEHFGTKLLDRKLTLTTDELRWSRAYDVLSEKLLSLATDPYSPTALPSSIPISIALATYDRPNDLCNCLNHLLAQQSPRSIEIIVIDNHPDSGLTPPVVAKFPGVKLVSEPRKGLAYARNAGFAASTGEIVIATDDDVTPPPDWIEKLLAPFVRPDVMVVTGNVLPIQLETLSQQAFESYGGLGKGFKRFEVDGNWFESFENRAVPTWELGATANAAFRASIFSHTDIGLMEEALGPGMPSGVGEDTYLFYKVLKAGYTLVYEPEAFVWHKHRQDNAALRRQIYNYSKGGPSYHLVTFLKDRDLRGLRRVLVEIPLLFLWRIQARIRKWTNYPMSLLFLEMIGNFAGPWSLWQSYRRVRHEGRSRPYIPISQR